LNQNVGTPYDVVEQTNHRRAACRTYNKINQNNEKKKKTPKNETTYRELREIFDIQQTRAKLPFIFQQ